MARVAVLYHGGPGGAEELKETQTAAQGLGIQVQAGKVQDPSQFQTAYAAMSRERANALIIFHRTFMLYHGKKLLELAAKSRLPTVCGQPAWSEIGGLITSGMMALVE